ncbi:flavin reductase family protein [Sneathiella aquimaris]|uniref:flavin reductase family protein n=1 Tax=Sneathiella aquimaris TaxID=2599305 RepID=UPI00146A1177|nr:flavin reductase family protein [Sneathiella aquimaris]
MTFDALEFRSALGCFATGITVVTSMKDGRSPLGITVNSFSSVSLDPPLVLFSLGHQGNHCQEFKDSGIFAINILSSEQKFLCDRFASPLDDRFNGIEHKIGENGSPVFEESLAVFECQTHETVEAGDHLIFICRVTNVTSHPEKSALLFNKGAFPVL